MRLIFFGTPDFSVPFLEVLIKADLKPCAVVTQPDRPTGRKQIIEETPVKKMALAHAIPVLQEEKINTPECIEKITSLKPDLIVVVAFGQIIPQTILDIPKYGCINVHPSLLPKYRGASPLQETLLKGDMETGVTIMLMDAKMDHGPILSQGKVMIDSGETLGSLRKKTTDLGTHLLIKTIKDHARGAITPITQDDTLTTYTRLLTRDSGKIDWSESAEHIDRAIRALNPWPGTWTLWHNKRLKILKAEVLDTAYQTPQLHYGRIAHERDLLLAYCNPGILIIQEVQLEGKKALP
ncbi:MAG: methionyl-tRNA formyltransferase, partial [bacterium]|nr:methionyl-tRNA formyltransferase [bacterium]